MKKFSWIMALLAALALIFVGVSCGGEPEVPSGDTDFEIVLGHNFQYGHGYQTQVKGGSDHIDLQDYFTGKVTEGEEFVIKFKVKADRDLEDQLAFGFVDPTSDAGYWKKLTEVIAIGPEGETRPAGSLGAPTAPTGGWLKKDVEIEINLDDVVAIATALGTGKANNKLYFQTSGVCTKTNCAAAGGCDWSKAADLLEGEGGVEGPLTLTITGFELKRKGEAAEPCCTDADCASCSDCAEGICKTTTTCGTDCCLPIPTFVLDGYDDTTVFTVTDATVVTLCAPTSINADSGAPAWELDGDTDVTYAELVGGTQLLIKLSDDISATKIGYLQLAVQHKVAGGEGYAGWEQHNVLSGGTPFPEITSGAPATWDADTNTITITLNAATVGWLEEDAEVDSAAVVGIKFAVNAGGAQNFEIVGVGVVIPD